MAQQFTQSFPQGGPPPGSANMMPGGGPRGAGFGMRGGLFLLPPPVMALIFLGMLALVAVAFWMIFKKAGYSGLLGLLMAVPVVNVVVLFWLAFAEWPVLTQLRESKAIIAMYAAESGDTPAVPPAEQPPVTPEPEPAS